MVVVIDNYDSFTYNLVQYLGELGAEARVFRNDAIDAARVAALAPDHVVISPGPCTPREAGASVEIVARLGPRVPLLGVCLGHQCVAQAFGGRIVHAREVMHGKTSPVHHSGSALYAGVPSPFEATRYHSLIVESASLPRSLEVTAWTCDVAGRRDEIMGLRHREHPVVAVQFHPESILTAPGRDLLRNFLGGAALARRTERVA